MSNTTTITGPVDIAALLSTKPRYAMFTIWLVGDTPLISHAWSEAAKRGMLSKQVKATKGGREKREPQEEFLSTLYEMAPKVYGYPVTGIKKAILRSAHKDKGIPKTEVLSALWLHGDIVRLRPAMAGAVCDVPLVRIYGAPPEMREDMVRVGSGLNKVANLVYRAQFTRWAIRLRGRFNASVISPESLVFLMQDAGMASGLGDWRNEKGGVFGAFHTSSNEEAKKWDKFADGKGPLPKGEDYAV